MSFRIILGEIPILETERIVLRPIIKEDAPYIFAYYRDLEVTKFLNWHGPATVKEAEELIILWNKWFRESYFIRWGIVLKESNKLIGTFFYDAVPVRFRAEMGYELSKESWNKGIMTEVVSKMLKFGFEELKFGRIQAIIIPENLASIKVLKKFNFKEEGLLRQFDYNTDEKKLIDVLMFALLKNEYKKAIQDGGIW